jgi:hypothetical protein
MAINRAALRLQAMIGNVTDIPWPKSYVFNALTPAFYFL